MGSWSNSHTLAELRKYTGVTVFPALTRRWSGVRVPQRPPIKDQIGNGIQGNAPPCPVEDLRVGRGLKLDPRHHCRTPFARWGVT